MHGEEKLTTVMMKVNGELIGLKHSCASGGPYARIMRWISQLLEQHLY